MRERSDRLLAVVVHWFYIGGNRAVLNFAERPSLPFAMTSSKRASDYLRNCAATFESCMNLPKAVQ